MDAEKRKAESGREHQKRAADYIAAEKKVRVLYGVMFNLLDPLNV